MIWTEGIVKRAGRYTILRGIDIQVGAGEVVAVMGPNGAGKSTLLKILALLTRPSAGRLVILGREAASASAMRSVLGVLMHDPLLYDHLTGRENLVFYARLYSLPAAHAARRVEALLGRVGLTPYALEPVSRYSQGMRQRLAIARMLLHQPQILLLDEPFTSLDATGAALLEEIIREHRMAGGATVLVTHRMERAKALADRAVLMASGRVTAVMPAGGLTPADLIRTGLNASPDTSSTGPEGEVQSCAC